MVNIRKMFKIFTKKNNKSETIECEPAICLTEEQKKDITNIMDAKYSFEYSEKIQSLKLAYEENEHKRKIKEHRENVFKTIKKRVEYGDKEIEMLLPIMNDTKAENYFFEIIVEPLEELGYKVKTVIYDEQRCMSETYRKIVRLRVSWDFTENINCF